MDWHVLLRGTLPPIVTTLLLVSLAGTRVLPLAMAVGLYVAHGLLKEWPALPQELWSDPNGVAWLTWGVIATGLLALAQHLRLLPARAATGVAVAVAALSVWLMLIKVASRWAATDAALHIGGGGLLVAATMLAVRHVIARRADATAQLANAQVSSGATATGPGDTTQAEVAQVVATSAATDLARTAQFARSKAVGVAALFTVMLSIDAALLVLGKSAFLGQLCGAVAATLGAAVFPTIWRRKFALCAADGIWIGGAHALFVLAGVHLSYLPWWPAGVALAAPFLLLLLPRGFDRARPLLWVVVAVPVVAVPLSVALWLAWPAPNPYGY